MRSLLEGNAYFPIQYDNSTIFLFLVCVIDCDYDLVLIVYYIEIINQASKICVWTIQMMRLINGIIYKSSNFEFSYAKPTIHCSIPILNHPDSSNFHRGKIVHRFRFGDERVEKKYRLRQNALSTILASCERNENIWSIHLERNAYFHAHFSFYKWQLPRFNSNVSIKFNNQ